MTEDPISDIMYKYACYSYYRISPFCLLMDCVMLLSLAKSLKKKMGGGETVYFFLYLRLMHYYLCSMKQIILTLLCLISLNGLAQFDTETLQLIDSLNLVNSDKNSHDTTIAYNYGLLGEIYYVSNLDTAIYLSEKSKILSEKGVEDYNSPVITKSFKKSLSTALNNIGLSHFHKGDMTSALKNYHKCLEIQEDINDKLGIAQSYNNMGSVFYESDIDKSLEYYTKALVIFEEIGDPEYHAVGLNNIGSIYFNQKLPEKALEYFLQSLAIRKEIRDKRGIAISYMNIGITYKTLEKYSKAIENYNRGLFIYKELDDKNGISNSLNKIGRLELKLGNINRAKESGIEGLRFAQEVGFPDAIMRNAELLSKVAIEEGDYEEALTMRNLEIVMKDSINLVSITELQTKFEIEKEQIIKENEAKEKARIEAQATKRRNNLQYSLILLGIIVLFGIVFPVLSYN